MTTEENRLLIEVTHWLKQARDARQQMRWLFGADVPERWIEDEHMTAERVIAEMEERAWFSRMLRKERETK
jgi:hypothetical protein